MIKINIPDRNSIKEEYSLPKFISTTVPNIKRSEVLNRAWESASNKEQKHIIIDSEFIKNNTSYVKIYQIQSVLRDCLNGQYKIKAFLMQYMSTDLGIAPTEKHCEKVMRSIMQIQTYLENDFGNTYEELLAKVLSMLKQFNVKDTANTDTYRVVFHVGLCTRESAILLHLLINLGYKAVYVNNFVDDTEFKSIKWLYKPMLKYNVETTDINKTDAYNDREDIREELKGVIQKKNYLGSIKPVVLQGTENEILRLLHIQLSQRPYYEFDSNKNDYKLPTIGAVIQGINGSIREYYSWIFDNFEDKQPIYIYKSTNANFEVNSIIKSELLRHLTKDGLRTDCIKGTHLEWIDGLPEINRETVVSIVNEALENLASRTEKLALLHTLCMCPKSIRNMIANFQFTRINPKIFILINNEFSMYDSLFITFLQRICFDIIVLQPSTVALPKVFDVLPKYKIGEYRDINKKDEEVYFRGGNAITQSINDILKINANINEVYAISLNRLEPIKVVNYKDLREI